MSKSAIHPLIALDANAIINGATELLPQLIDNMIALGEAAKEVKRQLGGNGHRAEKLAETLGKEGQRDNG